jgi:AAA domain
VHDPTPQIELSLLRHAYDLAPTSVVLSWDQLTASIAAELQPGKAATKEQLLGIVPAVLGSVANPNPASKGSLRWAGNVQRVTLGALDVDGLTPQAFGSLLERCAQLRSFVYTSPSDTPAVRKCRVLVPLDRPLAPSECGQWRRAMASLLGVAIEHDSRTLDPSRLFFVGAVRGTEPRQCWRFEGPVPPASWVLQHAPAAPPAATTTANSAHLLAAASSLPERAQQALAQTLAIAMVDGTKHAAVGAFGRWCLERGIPAADCYQTVARALELRSDSHGDVADIAAGCEAALWAYQTGASGGRGTLADLLGQEALDVLTHVARVAVGPTPAEQALADTTAAGERLAEAVRSPPIERGAWVKLPLAELERPRPEPWYLCRSLDLTPGAPAVLGAPGFSAKTLLIADLLLATVSGGKYLGRFDVNPRHKRALLIDYEMGEGLTARRFRRLRRGRKLDVEQCAGLDTINMPPALFASDGNGAITNGPQAAAFLAELVTGYDVCAIDALHSLAPEADENSATFRNILDVLTRVSLATGCCFVCVHHARKDARTVDDALRGSSAIRDGAGSVLVVQRQRREDGSVDRTAPLRIVHDKARSTGVPTEDFEVHIHDVDESGAKVELNPERDSFGLVLWASSEPLPAPVRQTRETVADRVDRWEGTIATLVLGKRMAHEQLMVLLGEGRNQDKRRAIAACEVLVRVDEYGNEIYGRPKVGQRVYYEHVRQRVTAVGPSDGVLQPGVGWRPPEVPI